MGRWRQLCGVVICAALFAGLGCSREQPGTRSATAAPGERKVTVSVANVEGRDVERSVQIVGTLMAQEEVTLGTEVPSTIAMILVDMGDRVQAGQVVIKLDEREARLEVERLSASLQAARESLGRSRQLLESSQANVERAQAVLADARINLKRFEGLFSEGAISASQRDSAQTQFDVAVASLRSSEAQYESDRAAVKNAEASVVQATAALDIARKRLQDTDVASPITGFVSKRLVNVGETLKEKTPLMSLVATHALKLQGDVPERFAPQVGVEHAVRVEVEAFPGQTFPGKITRVSPTVDVESRSFRVEASVPNPKSVLKPGFFAKASIVTGTAKNVPFVPEEAVASFAGIVKVYAILAGKAEERRVKTGVRQDSRVEILEGVKVGETVATSSLSQLATGTAVTIQTGSGNGSASGKGERGGPGNAKTERSAS